MYTVIVVLLKVDSLFPQSMNSLYFYNMVLVTGATGLLGAHVVINLIGNGYNVRAMYRTEEKKQVIEQLLGFYEAQNKASKLQLIEWFQGDILDVQAVEVAVKDCTAIIHCAGMVSFATRDFSTMVDLNRIGTANLVNEALAAKTPYFIHVSSTSAIGSDTQSADKIKRETNHWNANEKTSGYAVSKYSAEKEVWRGIEEGLAAVIVNPSVFFGPGNWSESSLNLFQTIQNGLLFYTKGGNAFVDVRDVSSLIVRLLGKKTTNERYIIGGHNLLFKDLFDQISAQLMVKPPRFLARKFLTEIAWRVVGIISFFTGKKPAITKDAVRGSHSITQFSSEKIQSIFPDFEFTPIAATIKNTIKGKLD